MTRIPFHSKLLHPRYWLSWVAIGFWWMMSQLPQSIQFFLGRRLGDLLLIIGGSRKHIAETNIRHCYPEMTRDNQKALLKATIHETAIAIFETGSAWFWPDWRFRNKYDVIGKEFIDEARNNKKGVLFLGIHFTTIEIGASMINLEFPISGFYRPHKNAVYEYIQAKGRIRRNPESIVIPKGDVRGIIKALRKGSIINYAPDQDYGREHSVFAPFFNMSTATINVPSHLAKVGKAEVIPWTTKRDQHTGRYVIEIFPSISSQLGIGELEDAITINTFIESEVRKNPSQYLWVHRRFKTRPKGEGSIY